MNIDRCTWSQYVFQLPDSSNRIEIMVSLLCVCFSNKGLFSDGLPPLFLSQVETSGTVISRLYGQSLHGSQARPSHIVGLYT